MIEYVCVRFQPLAWLENFENLGTQGANTNTHTYDVLLSSTKANAYYDLFKRVIKRVVIVASRGLYIYSPMHFTCSVYSALTAGWQHTHTRAHEFSAKRVAQATSSANMGGHVLACCGTPLTVASLHARSGFDDGVFFRSDDEDAFPGRLFLSNARHSPTTMLSSNTIQSFNVRAATPLWPLY